jgi:DNA-binding XRE family transcriptional regulator
MDHIKNARAQLGQFFKDRRIELGLDEQSLAEHVGISKNTLQGIERGRFAWDIDLQHRLCAVLGIKPYFSANQPEPDPVLISNDLSDPRLYYGFYIMENVLLYPEQLAILKMTYPRLIVLFNYNVSQFTSFDDWCANHTDVQWLDKDDKPDDLEVVKDILTECWNFLALHEREEERLLHDMFDDDDE